MSLRMRNSRSSRIWRDIEDSMKQKTVASTELDSKIIAFYATDKTTIWLPHRHELYLALRECCQRIARLGVECL
jgi:hypothetical protein